MVPSVVAEPSDSSAKFCSDKHKSIKNIIAMFVESCSLEIMFRGSEYKFQLRWVVQCFTDETRVLDYVIFLFEDGGVDVDHLLVQRFVFYQLKLSN